MKHTRKPLICLLLALAMLFTMAAPVYAASDPTPVPVTYMRYDSLTGELVEDTVNCIPINEVANDYDLYVDLSNGWYVVNGTFELPSSRVTFDNVNLVLADGAKLVLSYETRVFTGMNIYAQAGGTGEFIAAGRNYRSGIDVSGKLTVYGGIITASGGDDAPGIGWETEDVNSELTVFAGKVTANGGKRGAGIGAYTYDDGEYQSNPGKVTVYDGEIIATGGEYGAGIGGGRHVNGCEVTIYGGEITANGGENASGIGGGYYGHGGSFTVYGGTVNAYGNEESTGIGGGQFGQSGTVVIHDGTVNAYGGQYCPGIGYYDDDGYIEPDINNVKILGGTVNATGGLGGAGIGGGMESPGLNVEISDGTVTAIGGALAAGIGGGIFAGGGNVTVNGGNVTATSTAYEYADYYPNLPQAIGYGSAEDEDQLEILASGSLTVGEGLTVMGGSDAESLEVLEAPYSDRPYYMTVSAPAGPAMTETAYLEYNLFNKAFDEKTEECIALDGNSTALSAGWYVAEGEITVADRIQIDGDVNLILADGATLNAQKGINVPGGKSITIYGQSGGTGELNAVGSAQSAGIGGIWQSGVSGTVGSITIHGGKINASSVNYGAGIGSSYGYSGGTVVIYGGEVNAAGGQQAAGIGGGMESNGCTVLIYGGEVNATGGYGGAGIGGGFNHSGGSVTIYGGTVTASSVGDGAGIGGGGYQNGNGGEVTIYDGVVTATGKNAAGIGGTQNGNGANLKIYGGKVYAYGGNNSAGIGGGAFATGGTVLITGGEVYAYGADNSAGIGGGYVGQGATVTIEGGEVYAYGGDGGAGIGAGTVRYGGDVTITGGTVTAVGGSGAQGIGRGNSTAGSGTLTLGEHMAAKGGEDEYSLEFLAAPYDERPVYMLVKEAPASSFVWDMEGDMPAATLVLVWADGTVEEIPAEMAVDVYRGVATYTATATANGDTYTDDRTAVLSYTVNVLNGSVTSGLKDSYDYGDKIIVTADPAPEGKAFEGWYLDDVLVSTAPEYGRVVDRDLNFEARYTDQPVESKPTVVASNTWRSQVPGTDNYRTTLTLSWSVPEGYTMVEAGLYRAYAGSMPTEEKLLSKGTKKVSTLKNANGVYKLNITMGSNKNVYGLYYIGYVTYKNASGETLTEYTDVGCNPALLIIT